MPLYAYRCPECGTERDEFNSIAQMDTHAPKCCDNHMRIVIQPVRGSVQPSCGYYCPTTDTVITSHQQRRNLMAEHGLVEMGDWKAKDAVAEHKKKAGEVDRLAAKLDIDPLPKIDISKFLPAVA